MSSDPQNPMDAAGAALAAGAQGMLESRTRREIKARIPRVFHPLIPGEGGTVREAAGREVKRSVGRWISSLLFSIFFFVVFFGTVGAVLLFVVAVIVWALLGGGT